MRSDFTGINFENVYSLGRLLVNLLVELFDVVILSLEFGKMLIQDAHYTRTQKLNGFELLLRLVVTSIFSILNFDLLHDHIEPVPEEFDRPAVFDLLNLLQLFGFRVCLFGSVEEIDKLAIVSYGVHVVAAFDPARHDIAYVFNNTQILLRIALLDQIRMRVMSELIMINFG